MNIVAFDIGKQNIRCIQDRTIIYDQPAYLAIDARKRRIAYGDNALDLIGTRDVFYFRNLNDLFYILDHILEANHIFRLFHKIQIVFTCPPSYDETQIEKIKTHFYYRGASDVIYKPNIECAVIGSHLQISTKVCACLLHIGYSSSQLVLYKENICCKKSPLFQGSAHLDTYLKNWLHDQYNFQVSNQTIELVKQRIGQCQLVKNPQSWRIAGVDIHSQQMKYLELNENHMAQVLQAVIYQWSLKIYDFLSTLSKDEQEDVATRGILCCGGGFLLKNLSSSFSTQLNLPFNTVLDPQHSVLYGLIELCKRLEDTQ